MGVSRRGLILGGAGVAAVAGAGVAVVTDVLPGGPLARPVTGSAEPSGTVPVVSPGTPVVRTFF